MNKILHVDDEQDIRSIAKLSLQSIGGFEVTSCNSGDDAFTCLEAFTPDLILLDVVMPEMDGPAVLQRLKGQADSTEIPVIFMTAENHPDEVERLKKLGAIGVIAKPFDPRKLSDEVKRIWSTWAEMHA